MAEVFGPSVIFDANVKTNKNMSVLKINISSAENRKKIRIAKSRIASINYETLYLSQAGKLRIVFGRRRS